MVSALRPSRDVGATSRRDCHIRRLRFSLTELIVVMVILVVLGAIGAGAYATSKSKRSVSVAAGRVTDAIAMARQTAISENTTVALVLPVNSPFYSNAYDERLPERWDGDAPGIAMRICELDEDGDFLDWLPGHGWITLPERSYFNYDFTSSGLFTPLLVPSTEVGGGACFAIVFQPNGTLPTPGDPQIAVRPFSDTATQSKFIISVNWLTGLSETVKVEE